MNVTLQRADDLAYVESLLEREDLPTRDIRSKADCFWVAHDGDDRVGVGGIEPYGTTGLLRSVVVEPSVRGVGYGTAVCDALEAEAQSRGVETLFLLTTTAPNFFVDRGYVEIERSDAPTPIQETSEFAGLCPSSAVCMQKSL